MVGARVLRLILPLAFGLGGCEAMLIIPHNETSDKAETPDPAPDRRERAAAEGAVSADVPNVPRPRPDVTAQAASSAQPSAASRKSDETRGARQLSAGIATPRPAAVAKEEVRPDTSAEPTFRAVPESVETESPPSAVAAPTPLSMAPDEAAGSRDLRQAGAAIAKPQPLVPQGTVPPATPPDFAFLPVLVLENPSSPMTKVPEEDSADPAAETGGVQPCDCSDALCGVPIESCGQLWLPSPQ